MNWMESISFFRANSAVASIVSTSSSSEPTTNMPWMRILCAWKRSIERSILARSCFFWKSFSVRGLIDSKPTYTLKQLASRIIWSNVYVGFESINPRTLKLFQKKQDLEAHVHVEAVGVAHHLEQLGIIHRLRPDLRAPLGR